MTIMTLTNVYLNHLLSDIIYIKNTSLDRLLPDILVLWSASEVGSPTNPPWAPGSDTGQRNEPYI